MKKMVLSCLLATTAVIWAADAPPAKSTDESTEVTIKNDLSERLAVADQIVRLEISPKQIDEELAKGDLQVLINQLEGIEARKDDLKALREAMEAVTDKVVSSGKVWDEYSGRYATNYTLEELKELQVLLRHPLLLRRESIRQDFYRQEFQEVIFTAAGDVAVTEMKKVQKLITEIIEKLPSDRSH